MADGGIRWEWLDSFAGGLGGYLAGIVTAYGVVTRKVAGAHVRINKTNERVTDVEETVNTHTTAIAVLQSQHVEDQAHRIRLEQKQDEIYRALVNMNQGNRVHNQGGRGA